MMKSILYVLIVDGRKTLKWNFRKQGVKLMTELISLGTGTKREFL
jgi:hypothetical protein